MPHRPGPWIVDEDVAEGWNHHIYVEGTDDRICFMAHDPNNQTVCDANAKLIAAAPELLAACQEMEKYMTDCGYFGGKVPQHRMAARARNAIRKATV